MPSLSVPRPGPVSEQELLAALPAPLRVAGALETIRTHNAASGTRLVVFDDDPTGSQTVHDVPVLTLASHVADVAAAAAEPHAAMFVLTNSRAMDTARAGKLTAKLADAVLGDTTAAMDVRFVSRSDSTLRGHFPAETDALAAAATRAGLPYDGVLLCPAFPEAGRLTVGGIQWVRRGDSFLAAADTDYACDPAFGYTEATLPEWVAARTGGDPATVATISIAELREAGVGHVAARLQAVASGQVIVADAADAADLEVLCLALQRAEAAGKRLLYRTGPSFVRVRAGMPTRQPLTAADIYPRGTPDEPGLVVAGSHVPLTSRQLTVARARHRLGYVELDAGEVIDDGHRAAAEIVRCARALGDALAAGDALLATSRSLVHAPGHNGSLELACRVADAVSETVARTLDQRGNRPLRYVVAKGGITSAELATNALLMRRATIAGQLTAGQISVWIEADGRLPHTPYVVFPGNVGGDSTLAEILDTLAGGASQMRRVTGRSRR